MINSCYENALKFIAAGAFSPLNNHCKPAKIYVNVKKLVMVIKRQQSKNTHVCTCVFLM